MTDIEVAIYQHLALLRAKPLDQLRLIEGLAEVADHDHQDPANIGDRVMIGTGIYYRN